MWAYVALGGALGSMLRYGLGLTVTAPWATLSVNAVGGLAIGLLASPGLDPRLQAFLVIGLLGGFTTFSAFGLQTIELARANLAGALAYAAGTVLLVLATTLLGMGLRRAM